MMAGPNGYVLEWYELEEPQVHYYASYTPDGQPRSVTCIQDADVFESVSEALHAATPFHRPQRFLTLVKLLREHAI